MTAPRHSCYKSYRSTFYIFPALIPLVEILPWLLGLAGGLAGLIEFLRVRIWGRRQARILALLGGVFILAGAGIWAWRWHDVPAQGEGPVEVAANARSRVEAFNPPGSGELVMPATFGRIWEQGIATQILGAPVIAGDRILFGTNGKTLEALRLVDGARLWSMRKGEPVFANVTLSKDIAIIGEGVHTSPASVLSAFDPKTGAVKWERKFRSHLETEALIDEKSDRLWTAAGAEGLWSLRLSDGQPLWHAPVGHIDVRPRLLAGRIEVPAKLSHDDAVSGSALFELDAKSGKVIRQTPLPGNPMGDVLGAPDGGIIFSTAIGQVGANKPTDKGWLHAFTLDGRKRWSIELPAMALPEGSVMMNEKLVVLALKNGMLMAIHTETGETAWIAGTGDELLSDALVIPETPSNPALVVAVPKNGQVTIRHASDGKEVMRFKVKEGSYAAPVAHDDVLYIATPYSMSAYGPISKIAGAK